MIQLQVNGDVFDGFMSAEYTASMLEFTSEASFETAFTQNDTAPFFPEDDAVVLIDGKKVMSGYIYRAEVKYEASRDGSDKKIVYTVRDYTADLSDSNIDNLGDLAASLSFEKIIERVVAHVGVQNVNVVNEAGDIAPFDTTKDGISPEVGENAFDYLNRLALKRQVLLLTNADGNIAIVRNSGVRYTGKFQNSYDNVAGNNVISGSYVTSLENVFNKYVVRSSLGPASAKSPFSDPSGPTASEVSSQVGEFTDDQVRAGRQKVIVAEESATNNENKLRATWEANFARSNRFEYYIDLEGHSLDGEVLETNRIVQVYDDDAGINDFMLIESVTMTSDEGGNSTSLTLTDKDSFSLIVTEPQQEKKGKTPSNPFAQQ